MERNFRGVNRQYLPNATYGFWSVLGYIYFGDFIGCFKWFENGVKKGFDGIATNTMFMWTQTTSKAYKGLPKTRRYDFRNSDVDALKQKFPDLLYVSPRNQLGDFNGVSNVVRGTKTGAYTIYGDYPELVKQEQMDIIKGRFVNQQDILCKT